MDKEREAWAAGILKMENNLSQVTKRRSQILQELFQEMGVIGTLVSATKDVVLEAIKYLEQKESGSASQDNKTDRRILSKRIERLKNIMKKLRCKNKEQPTEHYLQYLNVHRIQTNLHRLDLMLVLLNNGHTQSKQFSFAANGRFQGET